MDQVIHIFRKDVCRHWIEIALSSAILVLFAWNEPSKWVPRPFSESIFRDMFSGWLAPIVTIGWLFLILRVVHAESLVGDRQFWITRPYEWKKLLAAKTLFLVTFINVPFLVAQVFLLWKAGFASSRFITGVLWLQLMWIVILILPMVTLATVTSSFTQTGLAVLGIIVSLIGLAALNSETANRGLSIARWIPEWLPPALLLSVFVAVIVWQYARRRTTESRWLLVGAVVAVLVITEVRPQEAFTADGFLPPAAGQGLPVQLSFDLARRLSSDTSIRVPMKNEVQVWIPLLVSGIAQNSAVSIDGVKVEIEASEVPRWNSGWIRSFSELLPTQPTTETNFTVDKAFLEQVKDMSAKVHILFALTSFGPAEVRRVIATADTFGVPSVALCTIYREEADRLRCRSPLKYPFLLASTHSEETTCLTPGAPPGTVFYARTRGWGSVVSGISPVEVFDPSFVQWSKPNSDFRVRFCPGTPLTFSLLQERQHTQSELTIDGLRLADYSRQINSGSRATGLGIAIP